jgi:hypothetical protein
MSIYEPLPDSLEPDDREFTVCPICHSWVHFTQEFCYKCMDDKSKWMLGVL